MENLEELTLNNLSELTKIKTNSFNPLINLRKLELTNNRNLKEIEEEAFGSIRNLEEVNIC